MFSQVIDLLIPVRVRVNLVRQQDELEGEVEDFEQIGTHTPQSDSVEMDFRTAVQFAIDAAITSGRLGGSHIDKLITDLKKELVERGTLAMTDLEEQVMHSYLLSVGKRVSIEELRVKLYSFRQWGT